MNCPGSSSDFTVDIDGDLSEPKMVYRHAIEERAMEYDRHIPAVYQPSPWQLQPPSSTSRYLPSIASAPTFLRLALER